MSGQEPAVLAVSSPLYPFPERGQGVGLCYLSPGDWLSAIREPSNPHDPNAILLYDERRRDLGYLGYLGSGEASVLAPRIDLGWIVYYLASTAYLRQSGDWTVEVMAFCCNPYQMTTIGPVLREIAERVSKDSFECRYCVQAASPGKDPYGLGFSLGRQDIPASRPPLK